MLNLDFMYRKAVYLERLDESLGKTGRYQSYFIR